MRRLTKRLFWLLLFWQVAAWAGTPWQQISDNVHLYLGSRAETQQHYADIAQKAGEDAKEGGTSETAGGGNTAQTNPQGQNSLLQLIGQQQGQQPPGNTTAQTNPDIGRRMQFEQPVQHQTPQPDTQGQGQPKKLNPLEGSYRSKSAP